MKSVKFSKSHRRFYPLIFDNNLNLFEKSKNKYTEIHQQQKRKIQSPHEYSNKVMDSSQRFHQIRTRSTHQLEPDNLQNRILKNSESLIFPRNVSQLRFKESIENPLMQKKRSVNTIFKDDNVRVLMTDEISQSHSIRTTKSISPLISRKSPFESLSETPKFLKQGLKTDYFIAKRNPITAGVDYRDLNLTLSDDPRLRIPKQLNRTGINLFDDSSPLEAKNVKIITKQGSTAKELINQENQIPEKIKSKTQKDFQGDQITQLLQNSSLIPMKLKKTKDNRDFKGDQITQILQNQTIMPARHKNIRDFKGDQITKLINGQNSPSANRTLKSDISDSNINTSHSPALRYLRRNNSQNIQSLLQNEGGTSPSFSRTQNIYG